jgi:hypothetical protein
MQSRWGRDDGAFRLGRGQQRDAPHAGRTGACQAMRPMPRTPQTLSLCDQAASIRVLLGRYCGPSDANCG